LAPMAGVTDLAFRLICKSYGAGGLTTEMVSAKGLYYKDKKTASLMMLDERERPASIQIFGSEPEIIGEIIPKVEEFSPSAIDINMGCPMPKIVNNGDGSCLMKNPELAGRVVKAAKDAATVPITVKIRKGWDSETAPEFAKVLEAIGEIQHTAYYARMGAAWAFAAALGEFPEETLVFFESHDTNTQIKTFTLRKARESRRITDEIYQKLCVCLH